LIVGCYFSATASWSVFLSIDVLWALLSLLYFA
jgi:hypothetical protein